MQRLIVFLSHRDSRHLLFQQENESKKGTYTISNHLYLLICVCCRRVKHVLGKGGHGSKLGSLCVHKVADTARLSGLLEMPPVVHDMGRLDLVSWHRGLLCVWGHCGIQGRFSQRCGRISSVGLINIS